MNYNIEFDDKNNIVSKKFDSKTARASSNFTKGVKKHTVFELINHHSKGKSTYTH